MKITTLAVIQMGLSLFFCHQILGSAPTGKHHTLATPSVCDGGYVSKLEVDQVVDANDTGDISFTLSGGVSLHYSPAYTTNSDGNLTYVAPAPYAWVTLLTASYLNQKPLCYTTDDSSPPILTSISFQ